MKAFLCGLGLGLSLMAGWSVASVVTKPEEMGVSISTIEDAYLRAECYTVDKKTGKHKRIER